MKLQIAQMPIPADVAAQILTYLQGAELAEALTVLPAATLASALQDMVRQPGGAKRLAGALPYLPDRPARQGLPAGAVYPRDRSVNAILGFLSRDDGRGREHGLVNGVLYEALNEGVQKLTWTVNLRQATTNLFQKLDPGLLTRMSREPAEGRPGLTHPELLSGLLHAAARSGNAPLAAFVISAGADVNARHDRGQTAAHEAATHGHAEVLEVLRGAKADFNLGDHQHAMPIMRAAQSGHAAALKVLLAGGATLRTTAPFGHSIAQEAARGGHVSVIRALKGIVPFDEVGGGGHTPLTFAAMSNQPEAIVELCRMADGVTVDALNGNGETALYVAARHGAADAIGALFACGASAAFEHGDSGNSPLHISASTGHPLAAEALLAGGADVDATNRKGLTALFVATQAGAASAVEMLMEHGANPSLADPVHGATPLHIAASTGDAESARALLARGANPHPANKRGETPLDVAKQHRGGRKVAALLSAGVPENARLHGALAPGATGLASLRDRPPAEGGPGVVPRPALAIPKPAESPGRASLSHGPLPIASHVGARSMPVAPPPPSGARAPGAAPFPGPAPVV